MFLYSMWPYVVIVGYVCVSGVPVLVKSGHRVNDSVTGLSDYQIIVGLCACAWSSCPGEIWS